MIFIDLADKSPPVEWLNKADALTTELCSVDDPDKRQAFIKKHASFWGELKDWLSELSNGKCWYSEARECYSYMHVDHFRPKAKVKDAAGKVVDEEGYWWLAFNWQNYRLAGGAGNTPKSTKFPIRAGTTRAGLNDDVDDEHPHLLDPTKAEDPGLLSFDESGDIRPGDPSNEWNTERAEVTIKVLNLRFRPLERERQIVWDQCARRVQSAINLNNGQEGGPSASKKARLRQEVQALRQMVSRASPLSAVASTCVRSHDVKWLNNCVFNGNS